MYTHAREAAGPGATLVGDAAAGRAGAAPIPEHTSWTQPPGDWHTSSLVLAPGGINLLAALAPILAPEGHDLEVLACMAPAAAQEARVRVGARQYKAQAVQCQVKGCPVRIEPNPLGKQYNIRYRLCDEHLRAERVLVQGQQQRFCQKCSKFQPLEMFEGCKRTCVKMLQLQTARRQGKGAPKAEPWLVAARAAAAVAAGDSWAPEEAPLPHQADASDPPYIPQPPKKKQRAVQAPPAGAPAGAPAAPDLYAVLLHAAAQQTQQPVGDGSQAQAQLLAQSLVGGASASARPHPSPAAKAIAAALAVLSQPKAEHAPAPAPSALAAVSQQQHAWHCAHPPPPDLIAAAIVCLSAPDGGANEAAQTLARYVLGSFMQNA